MRAAPNDRAVTAGDPRRRHLPRQVRRRRERDREEDPGVPEVAGDQQDQGDDEADADRRQPRDAVERHGHLFCATPMPPALTPDLALSYVRELSADVRAVVALGPGGEPLAGDPAVAAAARALLDAAPDAA